jgi:hypothetical protein
MARVQSRNVKSRGAAALTRCLVVGFVALGAGGASLAACGGHGSAGALATGCQAGVAAVVREGEQAPVKMTPVRSDATSVASCRYQATGAGACPSVDVTVDRGPRAYTRFQNTVTEHEQTFVQGGARSTDQQPVVVSGVGIEAVWIPAEHRLIAGAGDRSTSVTVRCPSASTGASMSLAERVGQASLAGASAVPPTPSGP